MYNFNRKPAHQASAEEEAETTTDGVVRLPVVDEPPVAETEAHAEPHAAHQGAVDLARASSHQQDGQSGEDDEGNDNDEEFAYDPTFQADAEAQAKEVREEKKSTDASTGRPQGAGYLLANGYDTSGAMNRFQAKRGRIILAEYAPPPDTMSPDEVLEYFRSLIKEHNATPPKPWRQIRFDLPATVAELRLVPPSPEPVQYKTPVIPSPCLVLLLDGAIPEGMSQKDYMVQMIQYLLDLMKYNNAATAITTLKFIKKGNELAQLVVTFGLDVRLAVKMLNSLQEAGVRAGFGQPIQDYKPNATFAVMDYKLTLNGGQGVSREQVEQFLTPFRETNTVDINVIDGYSRGVFYAPVKRPESVYSIIWNPYVSVIVQSELFSRFGILVTMAECPHFFLQKGVPYHIQKQQMELEKARLLLLRQQRGDIEANEEELGNIYDYVHTAAERSKAKMDANKAAGLGGRGEDGLDDDEDNDVFSDDDEVGGGGGDRGRHADTGAPKPNWLAQAEQVSLFGEDDLLTLNPGSAEPPSSSGGSSGGLTFVAFEEERRLNRVLKNATAKTAAPTATAGAIAGAPSAHAGASTTGAASAAASTAGPAPPAYGRGTAMGGRGGVAGPGGRGRGYGYGAEITTAAPGSMNASAADLKASSPFGEAGEGGVAASVAPPLDLPELVSDHDDDEGSEAMYPGQREPQQRAGTYLQPGGMAGGAGGSGSRGPWGLGHDMGGEPQGNGREPTAQQPEVFLSWNMAAPAHQMGAGGAPKSAYLQPPSSFQATHQQQQQQQQQQYRSQGPTFAGMDNEDEEEEEEGNGERAAQSAAGFRDYGYGQPRGAAPGLSQQYDPSQQAWGGNGSPGYATGETGGGYGWGAAPSDNEPYGVSYPSPGGSAAGQNPNAGYPAAPPMMMGWQGYYGDGGGHTAFMPHGAPAVPAGPLPMTLEAADELVLRIQDRVRNAFPSLRLVDPANADAMTEVFFSTEDPSRLSPLPNVVAPSAAKVPIPTTEMDELTDLLEEEYPRVKALLECYEPPLQAARARLAMTLMASRPQHESADDWTPYVEESSDDDGDDDAEDDEDAGPNESKSSDAKKLPSGKTPNTRKAATSEKDEAQLPALLPYLLTTHEGTELGAMLATFFPQEFAGLFARYCLPFLLDADVIQWVALSCLRADPSPNNVFFARVLQHWEPLMRWLNAFILLQAEVEEKKEAASQDGSASRSSPTEKAGAGTATTPSLAHSAAAKRLVSQLGNTMDLLLSGLSAMQRGAAANVSKAANAVQQFVEALRSSPSPSSSSAGDGVATLLWGSEGAARRTLLRLYLSADIIDGTDLAEALFIEKKGGQKAKVHSTSRDSFYFLLVALSKSLLSPSLNPQTAAFCGRYLQYMEVAAAAADASGASGDVLREKEAIQLVDAAFKQLAFLDAYVWLRQGYLVAQESVPHFPLVLAKLSNEVPPFPLAQRPQENFYNNTPATGFTYNAAPQGYYMSDPYGNTVPYYNSGGDYGYGSGGYGGYGGVPFGYGNSGGSGVGGAGGLLDGSSPTSAQPGVQATGAPNAAYASDAGAAASVPKPVDWAVVMKSYPASGEPFTPLPTGWTASLSRTFGQYYFKPSKSVGGSPSYTHPTDKTTFFVSPQAFIKGEANSAAALHEVIQQANARKRQQDPSAAALTREEVDAWLNDQRKRDAFLDAATMEKFSIQYKATATGGAAHAGADAPGKGGVRKRSRSPNGPGDRTGVSHAELTPALLTSRLTKLKNYPAKGTPFPDVYRGWSVNISSSTGLYVFRPPASSASKRKGNSSGTIANTSQAQELHPATKRRYRASPQEFVRHRNLKNEDIAKEAKVELVEVEEWMTDQRYRSPAMDAAVVKLAKVNYAFREELDAEKGVSHHAQGSSRGGAAGGGSAAQSGRDKRGGRRTD